MNFYIDFKDRAFTVPIMPALSITPLRMSWSAFGGPDQVVLSARGALADLLQLLSLLRCPVTISDAYGTHVWWGYVDEVTLFIEGTQFKIALEDLFNKVTVQYSFISPDHKLADRYTTAAADNPQSQSELGIKEITLNRADLDDQFAESLRDTFLSLHAWPKTELSQRSRGGDLHAQIKCSGWFRTLQWRAYAYDRGFVANYGPGPGTLPIGDGTNETAAQNFTNWGSHDLVYAYFNLRRQGNPAGNMTARLHSNTSGSPGAIVAASQNMAASSLPAQTYQWTKFTFSTPIALTSGNQYWISLHPGGADPSNYLLIKTDENLNFRQDWRNAKVYSGGAWSFISSVTAPGFRVDLYFRLICQSDTGSQLLAIATAGNQFFNQITALSTGISACPYRDSGADCYENIVPLMQLGTANGRLVLANVDDRRNLSFYEQPNPSEPTIHINRQFQFFTFEGIPLKAYHPPVGQFARFAGASGMSYPFDHERLPACFIHSATYYPGTGHVKVQAM